MPAALRQFLNDDLAKRLLTGGASAALIKVISAGAAYAMFVVLAWLMTAQEYGRLAFGISLALTLSIVFSFGLPVASLRFWPQHREQGEIGLARGFAARAFLLVTAGSALATLLFLGAATAVTWGDRSFGTGYWVAVGVLIWLMAVTEFTQSALRADGVIVRSLAPRDVGWRLAVIAGSIAVAGSVAHFSAELGLWVAAACLAMIAVPHGLFLFRRLSIGIGDGRGPAPWRQWMPAVWPIWAASVLIAMVQQFDVVLLGFFVGPEETGPYFAALRTATLMTLLLFASNMVAAPLFSKYYHGADWSRLQRMSRLLILGIAGPTVLGFIAIMAFGEPLLAVFDPEFAKAYWLLVVLSAGFAITALAGPVNYALQMIGLERQNLRIQASVYAVVVAAQCVLVPVYGAIGAAIPNALGALAASCWAIVLLRRRTGIDTSIASLVWPVRPNSTPRIVPAAAG